VVCSNVVVHLSDHNPVMVAQVDYYKTEAGDRAIEDFSRALLQAIPNIVDVIFSALGAIVSSNQKIYS